MKRYLGLLLYSVFATVVIAQPLKPHIGLQNTPTANSPICTIPIYTGNYDQSGLQKGDTIADFTLYDLNYNPVTISQELGSGKPILLVAGSYTCPVFRNRIAELNQVYQSYNNQIKIFVVYTVEAHPTDASPYSGNVWVTSQNQQENILYPQPTTYGDRLSIVNTMKSKINILPTILIDGPCNEWWSHFGPAPNNAYLINQQGVVFRKHGWFNKAPENIFCDIDSILGLQCSGTVPLNGTFSFKLTNDSVVKGIAGEVLHVFGEFENKSSGAAEIEITRVQNNMTLGWESAMCVDICLASTTNQTTFILGPGAKQLFTMYFYTSPGTPNTGSTRIRFKNKNIGGNTIAQNFYGETTTLGIGEDYKEKNKYIYPNPGNGVFNLKNIQATSLSVFDQLGRTVFSSVSQERMQKIDLSFLSQGLYLISLKGDDENFTVRLLIQN